MDLASPTPASPQPDPQIALAAALAKTCTRCGETKPLSEFGKHATGLNGLRAQCRQCRAISSHEFNVAYPEVGIVNLQRWRSNNPEKRAAQRLRGARKNAQKVNAYTQARRALKLDAPGRGVTADEWLDILAAADGVCAYCDESGRLTMDHVVPLSRGGAHDIDNIVAACGPCNSSKKDMLLSEWLPQRTQRAALA